MYLPRRFTNLLDRSLAIMRASPLATVVSVTAGQEPFVSHLPLIVEREGDRLRCVGHLARASRGVLALMEDLDR